MRRRLRVAATLVVTGLCTAYIVWKIDVGHTAHVLAHADAGWWFARRSAIMVGSRLADGAGAGSGCSPRAASTTRSRWLVRTYFVGYAAGQVLPTSLGGDASRIYETTRRHPGARRCRRRDGAARARARRRRDARARGGRVRARRRPLRRRRLPLGRARVRRRGGRSPAIVALLDAAAPAAPAHAAAAAQAAARAAAARGLPRRCTRSAATPRAARSMFALTLVVQAVRVLAIWCAGQGGRRRPLAAAVLRDGAAALPRHARAVHGERARGARVVLRLVPRRARRRRRPRVRDGLPVLRRDDRAGAARRRDRRLGGAARRSRAAIGDERRLGRGRHVQRAAVDRAVRSRAFAASRRSSSTTARPTARSRSCASAFPTSRWSSRRTAASPPAGTRASRARRGRYVLLLNSDAWLDEGALDALVAFADAHPRRGGRRAAPAQSRRARCSARCAASRRSWRLATEYLFLRKLAPRSRALNAFYAGGFDHDAVREAESLMGAVLARAARGDRRGRAGRRGFFLFSEETDWALSLPRGGLAGRCSSPARGRRTSAARRTRGALFAENQRGHLRFLTKHRGDRYAAAAALIIRAGLVLRGRRS